MMMLGMEKEEEGEGENVGGVDHLYNHTPFEHRIEDRTGDGIARILRHCFHVHLWSFFAFRDTHCQAINNAGSHTSRSIVYVIWFDIPYVHDIHATGRNRCPRTTARFTTQILILSESIRFPRNSATATWKRISLEELIFGHIGI